MTSTAVTDPLLSAVAAGVRHVEPGHPYFTGMPCSPNHPGLSTSRQARDTAFFRYTEFFSYRTEATSSNT